MLFSAFEGGTNYRRGLDGRVVASTADADGPRRRLLDDGERGVLLARLAERLRFLSTSCRHGHVLPRSPNGDGIAELESELARVSSWNTSALDAHADRFRSTYLSIPILPPDQYMSLVLQLTSGCPWNRCSFCALYRDRSYQAKSADELDVHLQAVRALFGAGLSLRRSLFLGDGNLLSVPADRLVAMLQQVREAFPEPRFERLYGFSDVINARACAPEYARQYRRAGLRRLYIGMETGCTELRTWLNKPGDADGVVEAVLRLRQADVRAGPIVLLGAGGHEWAARHERDTIRALQAMDLGPDDRLFFSPLRLSPDADYAQLADPDDLLSEAQMRDQRARIEAAVRTATGGPRTALYDIVDFAY